MKTLQETHEYNIAFVRELYESNTDPAWDMLPQLVLQTDDKVVLWALADGPPMDMASRIIAANKPTMMSFISPIWCKDPEAPDVRVGEGVMIITETETAHVAAIFEVKRDPLPRLIEPPLIPDTSTPRVPLLYNPNHTEH